MDLLLLAASASGISGFLGTASSILMAALGLGLLIFVHELGHYAVARMCGVKCEKFMVGFDFGGLKLSRKWGETEYGIGVFPLGGYVKMLGQDDDPSKTAEQIEATKVSADSEFAKEITGPDGEKKYIDRRSYQAKSVPQRMAIISAGVIMNMIFAFIFAFFAFGLGVEYPPCVISRTSPGLPAWEAGLEAGDEFIQIGDRTEPSFEHLKSGVTLADLDKGVEFQVRRAATGEVEPMTLKPEQHGGVAIIGIDRPRSNVIYDDPEGLRELSQMTGLPNMPPGATITSINGEPTGSYRDIVAIMAASPDKALELTLELPAEEGAEGQSAATPETTTITLAPSPARTLGLVMTMGPVTSVQKGSPAEAAGLKVGDTITAVDGQSVGGDGIDPASIDAAISKAEGPVELTVLREGAESPESVSITPRPVTWLESPMDPKGPMPAPSIGVAYDIQPVVTAVLPGSPAAEADLEPGDAVTAITITPPAKEGKESKPGKKIEVSAEKRHWPYTVDEIQSLTDGGTVTLELKRGEKTVTASMAPIVVPGEYVADRGLTLMLRPIMRKRHVSGVSEQLSYAADRTWFSLTMVVRVIQKLISQQVPADQLGGPLMILQSSYLVASAGWPEFLLFLTLISANLAVLNFLPIPVLDGGHMVFLAYEGITGRPAPEKLMMILQTVGVLLLLSLMIFVTGNDILRFMKG